MEIRFVKRTFIITSKSTFNTMFILVLIATIVQIAINVLSNSELVTGMVIYSACVTCLCYYLSKDRI